MAWNVEWIRLFLDGPIARFCGRRNGPGGAFVHHFRDSLSTEFCPMDLISVLHVVFVVVVVISVLHVIIIIIIINISRYIYF